MKITKVRVKLWYGFNDVTLPFGRSTFLFGENGSGKSAFIDALSYALYGDVNFNSAASDGLSSARTLWSYTRMLLDRDSGKCARPASTYPDVNSAILLELDDDGTKTVLGTLILTRPTNETETKRFIAEGRNVSEIKLAETKGNLVRDFYPAEVAEANGLVLNPATEGLLNQLDRMDIHLGSGKEGEARLRKFRRAASNVKCCEISENNPEIFIKKYILPEKNITAEDINGLKDTADTFRKDREILEKINNEINDINGILEQYEKIRKIDDAVAVDDIKKDYKNVIDITNAIRDKKQYVSELSAVIETGTDELDKTNAEIQKKENDLDEIRTLLKEMNGPLDLARKELERYRAEGKLLESQCAELCEFQRMVNESIENGTVSVPEYEGSLKRLTGRDVSTVQKNAAVNVYKEALAENYDETGAEIKNLVGEYNALRRELAENDETIKKYTDGAKPLRGTRNAEVLRDDINNELKKNGVAGREAFLACDAVSDVDAGWQKAIESYLGNARYAVLVYPEDYSTAVDVLHRGGEKRYGSAGVIDTERMMKKKTTASAGSAASKLAVPNPIAAKYFEWKLGFIQAVETRDELKNLDSAMLKDGLRKINLQTGFSNSKDLEYAFGNEAVRRNLESAKKVRSEITGRMEAVEEKKHGLGAKRAYIKNIQNSVPEFGFDVIAGLEKAKRRTAAAENEVARLEQETENNGTAYFETVDKERIILDELDGLKKARMDTENKLARTEAVKETSEADLEKIKAELETARAKMDGHAAEKPALTLKAKESYDDYVLHGTKTGNIRSQRTREDYIQDRGRFENELRRLQQNYCDNYGRTMPVGVLHPELYREKLNGLKTSDLEKWREKIKRDEEQYLHKVRTNTVSAIDKAYRNAEVSVKKLNNLFRQADISEQYKISLRPATNNPVYSAVLALGRHLRESKVKTGGQLSLFDPEPEITDAEADKLQNQVSEAFSEALEKAERDDEEMLNKLCDYTNYIKCRLMLKTDSGWTDFASYQRTCSGAEHDIPYMIMLVCAYTAGCGDGGTKTVLIDEAFKRMSDDNSSKMVDFLEEAGCQTVMCSSAKMGSIGEKCDAVHSFHYERTKHIMTVIDSDLKQPVRNSTASTTRHLEPYGS